MELPFATLDVFTSRRMQGNPLAVVTVPAALRDRLGQDDKQRVAREFNLSETVFLHEAAAADSGGGSSGGGKDRRRRDVDIFTVDREIPFAGHPTIGTAVWCLAHEGEGGDGMLETLVTKAGPIAITSSSPSSPSPSPSGSASASGQQTRTFVSAKIPHNVRVHAHTLADIVGTAAEVPGLSTDPAIRRAELAAPVVSIVRGMTFVLVRLDSLEMLSRVVVSGLDYDGLSSAVSAAAEAEAEAGGGKGKGEKKVLLLDEGWRDSLVARYYYVDVPSSDGAGGDGKGFDQGAAAENGEQVRQLRTRMIEFNMEDPATGSAASALACYLTITDDGVTAAGGREKETRRRKFVMTQGVEMGRTSVISLETSTTISLSGEVAIDEVHLGGTAVVVMKGVLTV